MTTYESRMGPERITVSTDDELAVAIRAAADADRTNVSAWRSDEARRRLASRGVGEVVAEWEQEHGVLSDAELAAARARAER